MSEEFECTFYTISNIKCGTLEGCVHCEWTGNMPFFWTGNKPFFPNHSSHLESGKRRWSIVYIHSLTKALPVSHDSNPCLIVMHSHKQNSIPPPLNQGEDGRVNVKSIDFYCHTHYGVLQHSSRMQIGDLWSTRWHSWWRGTLDLNIKKRRCDHRQN